MIELEFLVPCLECENFTQQSKESMPMAESLAKTLGSLEVD
jgi:hypothetical protein